ncbi:MAG: DUF1206 domain-containing protein [Planctomycetes bacterium]|nr:DUF1206 domain-containing protein [Planctomycetota bacterium]
MELERRADAAIGPTPTDGRHRWLERLARAGYAARGLVYVLIGILAVRAAMGAGGETTGPRGALREFAEGPFGTAVIALMAIGLAGYALWRVIQGVRDTEGKGREAKGLWLRAGMIGSGLIHAGWAVLATGLAFGSSSGGGSGGEDAQAQGWTATLMMQPFGRWMVAALGIGIVVFGINQLRQAWTDRFKQHVAIDHMRERTRTAFTAVGRSGLAARGVTFLIAGGFLLTAAWRFDPAEAKGLGGSLAHLLEQPFGPIMLGVVALGVVAFGLYNAFLARFQVIRPR